MKILYAMIYAPEKGGSGAPIYTNSIMKMMGAYDERPGIIFSVHHSYTPSNLTYDLFPLYFDRPPIFDNQPKVQHSIAFKDMSQLQIDEYINAFFEGFKLSIRDHGYEMLHVQHGMYIGYAAQMVKRLLGIPYVITLHVMELNFLEEFPDPMYAMAAMVYANRIIALTEAQKRRLLTEYSKERIIKLHMKHKRVGRKEAERVYKNICGNLSIDPERVTVCPLGIDTQMFSLEKSTEYPQDVQDLHLPDNQKIVMFAGRLIDMKGIKHLLAAETIYNNRGDVETLVLGGGQLEDYVREAERERPNVHYLGFKEQNEMPAYHRFLSDHHGVFSVPSSSEGLSIVYLETMASGNPIVGCCKRDMGELPFMQPPYAYFVPFGDPASLALRISALLEKHFDPHDIRDRMDIYNLHNMFNDVFAVYSSVYKEHYSFVCRNVDIVTP